VLKLRGKLNPGHPRHLDIRQQQMDGSAELLCPFESVLSVGGHNDVVSAAFEHREDKSPHVLLIFRE
jgi:hypothetical protein